MECFSKVCRDLARYKPRDSIAKRRQFMKKIAIILAGLILMAASSAWALPTLTLSDGISAPVVVEDNSILDGSSIAGVIGFSGAVGLNWTINMTTGMLGQAAGSGVPQMVLTSADSNALGNGVGNLTITFSGLTGPWTGAGATATANGNSSSGGSATFETWVDSVLMSTLTFPGLGRVGGFGGAETFSISPEGEHSIGMIANITQTGTGSTSFEHRLTPVPEAGTMLLLGTGFLGLAIYSKRRMRA
jgi:hypothetical protein